jgi:hypothetical protein
MPRLSEIPAMVNGIVFEVVEAQPATPLLMNDNERTELPAGPINNVGLTSGPKPASAATCSRRVTVEASTYNPTRAAFLLLREVYVWFGHAEEDIPYVTGSGDDKEVDTSVITSLR